MSRRAATVTIQPSVAFWRTGSFRFACVAAAVCGLVSLTWWLQEENIARQMQRKLQEDATLSQLASDWARLIPARTQAGKRTQDSGVPDTSPKAVWFGKVSRFQSSADMALLTLSDAILVAGERAKGDQASQVRVAPPRGYRFASPPATGEMWLVAVSRNDEGSNIIRFAEKCRNRESVAGSER